MTTQRMHRTEEQERVIEYICQANDYVRRARIFAEQNPNLARSLIHNPEHSTMEPDLAGIEEGNAPAQWGFGGASYSVAQSLRIPYTYTSERGLRVRAHLLIGFEGSYAG